MKNINFIFAVINFLVFIVNPDKLSLCINVPIGLLCLYRGFKS